MSGWVARHSPHEVSVEGTIDSRVPVIGPQIASAIAWLQKLRVRSSYMTRVAPSTTRGRSEAFQRSAPNASPAFALAVV